MLSHYSTLIQLIAAVYFSLCFDGLIKRLFWSEKFNGTLLKRLEEMNKMFEIKRSVDDMKILVDKKTDMFAAKAAKLSAIMFSLCSLLLFLSGLEQTLINKDQVCCFYNSIQCLNFILFFILALQFFLNRHWILNSWIRTIGFVIIILILLTSSFFVIDTFKITEIIPDKLKIDYHYILFFALFIISMPLLLMLFRSWLSSANYLDFMNYKIENEGSRFKEILMKLLTDQTINDSDYNSIIADIFLKTKETGDSISRKEILHEVGNKYIEITCDKIEKIILEPNFFVLLKFSIKNNIYLQRNYDT